MTGRESVFSNDAIIQLASEQFIPVAENSSALERQADDKGTFFHHFAEQGHYGGRTKPTTTRQGSYTFRADGTFLASVNSRDADVMAEMMREALERFDHPEKLGDPSPVQMADAGPDVDLFPSDGLVLQATVRDLPRPDDMPPGDDRWNLDYVWIRRDEARQLAPATLAVGERRDAPWPIMRRLARFHLRDYVRGEPFSWQDEAIERAELSSEIVEVDGSTVRLALNGSARLAKVVAWYSPEREEDMSSDTGYHCMLQGEATWDDALGAFTAFDLVASGSRWGTNHYNFRQDDLGPAPMGIAFSLAGTTPSDRTPPHCLRTWVSPVLGTTRRSRVSVAGGEYFG